MSISLFGVGHAILIGLAGVDGPTREENTLELMDPLDWLDSKLLKTLGASGSMSPP